MEPALPTSPRPQHVGILTLEVYIPPLKVLQADLEEHDGVPGKYTIGYGQTALAVCSAREDATSMAMTALAHLMRKHRVTPESIGRLDVGSESGTDGAKSIKSSLMALFDDFTDVEGGDHKGACYAGTAALLSAVDWVAGEGWDGRFAVVVLTDVAMYTEPAARATGGAGAVAILVGPDAPLPLQRAPVASHCQDIYDWFKPCGVIPQVNGKLSVSTYLDSLKVCCSGVFKKSRALLGSDMNRIDFACLHHPYNKLVRKGAEELDRLLSGSLTISVGGDNAAKTGGRGPTAKGREGVFYEDKIACTTRLGRECGNMLTASLYACLASLIDAQECKLEGKTLLMYSFGSGSMSSAFLLKGRAPKDGRWRLSNTATKLGLCEMLASRKVISPTELEKSIERQVHLHKDPRELGETTAEQLAHLRQGTYYLKSISSGYLREYGCQSQGDAS